VPFVETDPRDPPWPLPDFVPPDPGEPPPVELWSAVGDVPPWGTGLLLLAWAALFALLAFRDQTGDAAAVLAWGASATGLPPLESSWRLLASTFLHAGPAHVFFNAASMAIFGPAVERIFTRWGFWIVFTGGGALASLASLLWRSSRPGAAPSLSVGASGAIFALGGALLVGAFRLRRRLAPGRARALGAALIFLLAQGLVAGFTRLGTDNAAHAAGLLGGATLAGFVPLSTRLGGARPPLAIRALGLASALALASSLALAIRSGLGLG
jgi:rhomboid protease GluP